MDIKRAVKNKWVIGSVAFAALVAVRAGLEPKPAPPVVANIPSSERDSIRARIRHSAIERPDLVAALARKRILLVGESHFKQEPQAWLQDLLEELHRVDGRDTILLLELPQAGQAHLDKYMAGGDEEDLRAAFGSGALPYQGTVRWARSHPQFVNHIIMCDADQWHTNLMRLLLTDTRNERMARRVAETARNYPGSRIVIYGGALHMMKAGRYLYDSDTRRPVGQRLTLMGLPSRDVAAVWLFAGPAPVHGLWDKPGALDLSGPAGNLPIADFGSARVFGAAEFKEIVDYAVHLGPATPIRGF